MWYGNKRRYGFLYAGAWKRTISFFLRYMSSTASPVHHSGKFISPFDISGTGNRLVLSEKWEIKFSCCADAATATHTHQFNNASIVLCLYLVVQDVESVCACLLSVPPATGSDSSCDYLSIVSRLSKTQSFISLRTPLWLWNNCNETTFSSLSA